MSWDDRGNLHKNLPLCISVHIILIENRQIERDLVNRALGTIKDFYQFKDTNINKDLPTILMAFNKYNSLYINQDKKGHQIIPIILLRREFQIENTTYT